MSILKNVHSIAATGSQIGNIVNTVRGIFGDSENDRMNIITGLKRENLLTEQSMSAKAFEPFRRNKFLVRFPYFTKDYFDGAGFTLPANYYNGGDNIAGGLPFDPTVYETNQQLNNGTGITGNTLQRFNPANAITSRNTNGNTANAGLISFKDTQSFCPIDRDHDGLVAFIRNVKLERAVRDYKTIEDTINGHKQTYIAKGEPITGFSITYKDSNTLELLDVLEAWMRYEMFAKKYGQTCQIFKFKNNWSLEPVMYEAFNIVPQIQTDLEFVYGDGSSQQEGKQITVSFKCSDIVRRTYKSKEDTPNKVLSAITQIGLGTSPAMLGYLAQQMIEPVNLPMVTNMIARIARAKVPGGSRPPKV